MRPGPGFCRLLLLRTVEVDTSLPKMEDAIPWKLDNDSHKFAEALRSGLSEVVRLWALSSRNEEVRFFPLLRALVSVTEGEALRESNCGGVLDAEVEIAVPLGSGPSSYEINLLLRGRRVEVLLLVPRYKELPVKPVCP